MLSSPQEKPIKIFNKACPDIIFANKRILKLKTLATYETSSIKTKKGAIASGTPLGSKRLTVSHWVLKKPIILIPVKWLKAKKNVITKELVTVKE